MWKKIINIKQPAILKIVSKTKKRLLDFGKVWWYKRANASFVSKYFRVFQMHFSWGLKYRVDKFSKERNVKLKIILKIS